MHSLVSGADSFCLDIPGGQQTPGLGMQIYRCNGTVSQEWELRAISPFVPNLVGLNETVAEQRIIPLFNLENPQPPHMEKSTTNCTSRQQDMVTDQDTGAGFQVPPGTVVTLTICRK